MLEGFEKVYSEADHFGGGKGPAALPVISRYGSAWT